ncbi:hypothetical protein R9X47_03160 [Wukongibacter baidiensis]|uniref:hypothetical protein n=1 Tax=Wukongibacter baidiensis TaxID=1723361 RepID=UPI003D7F8053
MIKLTIEISNNEKKTLIVSLKKELIRKEKRLKYYMDYSEDELDEKIESDDREISCTRRKIKEDLEKQLNNIKSILRKLDYEFELDLK